LLGTTKITRRELLPEEPAHARSDHVYVRLALGPLAPLPRPIPSRRLRRIVFIPTTRAKLETAGEINDLFHASPLEVIVWQALKAEGLQPKREYYVPGDLKGMYALDFALFGQRRNLDIECDGDAYHLSRASARYDNRRNNFLTSRGWSVLRFTSAQIAEELPDVMYQVRTAVKDCGGMAAAPEAGVATPARVWQPGLWGASTEGARDLTPRLPTPRKARPATTRRRRAAQQGELPHSIVEQLALF